MDTSEKHENESLTTIEERIFTLRGQQVMIDKDLACYMEWKPDA